ncbi:uncharacterized protein LOC125206816 [Salvia hispanica]|uniref:uncharacterized protein LOC125206816 n=1 Tax=Salvia hispanica TaxID=49212 RepID=UPI0020099042|nr:uncharacterized protein LOC125206816 [Salvia hispanica]
MDDLWNQAWDSLIQEMQREADEAAAAAIPREIRHRRTIPRDHVGAAERLMADYFSADPRYPAEIFRRRFRMSRPLFTHIATTLADRFECFTLRSDCTGRIGLSTLQKCTSAIRQLAYAGPADMFDEYLQMGETTSLNVLRQFCKGIREVFGLEFLRKPTFDECQRRLDMHGAVHNFPGMMGSIDCMHWEWKNCPVAWKGQFTTSKCGRDTTGFKQKHPSMILEAVADYRLRIWHAYFGVAGSNNDINVLQSSSIFTDECRGEGPEISFVANGTQYRRGYYLADGIYPRWPVFVKTLRQPAGAKRQYFARKQEAARKDVERAFGVLQARWAILRCPARVWHGDDVANIMVACIILHNMIIEDEGFATERWAPEDGASTSHGVAFAPIQMGVPRSNEYLIQRFADIRKSTTHDQLQVDLIEEVWARRGGDVA